MQFKVAFTKKAYKEIAIALPTLFLVMMFSDSYLLGHYTTLLFVYFSAFLYKNFDNEID
jgi:O-antigen ligase